MKSCLVWIVGAVVVLAVVGAIVRDQQSNRSRQRGQPLPTSSVVLADVSSSVSLRGPQTWDVAWSARVTACPPPPVEVEWHVTWCRLDGGTVLEADFSGSIDQVGLVSGTSRIDADDAIRIAYPKVTVKSVRAPKK